MNHKDKTSLGHTAGQIIGVVLAACFVAVVCAFVLAVTLKAVISLYGWVF